MLRGGEVVEQASYEQVRAFAFVSVASFLAYI